MDKNRFNSVIIKFSYLPQLCTVIIVTKYGCQARLELCCQ